MNVAKQKKYYSIIDQNNENVSTLFSNKKEALKEASTLSKENWGNGPQKHFVVEVIFGKKVTK